MKIRYYLRGLGLGILVTAIFFMTTGNKPQTMSDEMIKARAKELGMSESMVLAELPIQEETVSETEEEIVQLSTEEELPEESSVEFYDEMISEEDVSVQEEMMTETETSEVESEETITEDSISEEISVEEELPEETGEMESVSSNMEPVLIVVNRGEGSDAVSRHMFEAGLVADAYEYDRYLMANGYDKRIGAGEHSIPAGATWEEMARILCNMK